MLLAGEGDGTLIGRLGADVKKSSGVETVSGESYIKKRISLN